MLRIRLFGHLTATADGETVRLSAAGAAVPLLAYLLLHRGNALPRPHVAFTLWPDLGESDALAHLRRQLHVLTRTLPEARPDHPWIVADRTTVQWNRASDYWLDVEAFGDLCASGDVGPHGAMAPATLWTMAEALERGVRLYRGDLLADSYDDWVLDERERLARLYSEALERLAGLLVGGGDLHGAAAAAQRLVACDPLREEAHRLLVGLTYLAGDRAAALKAYAECRSVLARQLDVAPMPETTQLAEAVRAGASREAVLARLRDDLPRDTDTTSAACGAVPTNLPRSITCFVGRKREMASILRILAASRLVTLTGPPGCGKTRLALEVAERVARARDARSAGVERSGAVSGVPGTATWPVGEAWWVDLTSVSELAGASAAVAAAMGARQQPEESPVQAIERHVRTRSMLLVLDNADPVVAECARLADHILRSGPRVSILATSRQILGLVGEHVYRVPPLSSPAPEAATSAASLRDAEGPQLLVDRARHAAPSFELTDANAAAVAGICRGLDGNALAIELMAPRLRDYPAAQLLERLDRLASSESLASRRGGGHHESLDAAIDWSHQPMSADQKTLFRRLSVFRGGFSLESAEAVCSEGMPVASVADLLAALVDRSLVEVAAQRGMRRYRLSVSVRRFALTRLGESGEEGAVRSRHLGRYLELAEEAEAQLPLAGGARWFALLDSEQANVDAALAWSIAQPGEWRRGARLAVALRHFWIVRGHLDTGVRWLGLFVSSRDTDAVDELGARLEYGAGSVALWRGCLSDAERHLHTALSMSRRLADARGEAWALNDLALLRDRQGRMAEASQLLEESVELKRALADWWDVARSMANLGQLAWRCGDYETAERRYREAMAVCQDEGIEDAQILGGLECNLGELALARGETQQAHDCYRRGLAVCHEIGDAVNVAFALAGLGTVAAISGCPHRAATLLASASTLWDSIGYVLDPASRAQVEAAVTRTRGQMTAVEWAAACAHGRSMAEAVAVSFALAGRGEDPSLDSRRRDEIGARPGPHVT